MEKSYGGEYLIRGGVRGEGRRKGNERAFQKENTACRLRGGKRKITEIEKPVLKDREKSISGIIRIGGKGDKGEGLEGPHRT